MESLECSCRCSCSAPCLSLCTLMQTWRRLDFDQCLPLISSVLLAFAPAISERTTAAPTQEGVRLRREPRTGEHRGIIARHIHTNTCSHEHRRGARGKGITWNLSVSPCALLASQVPRGIRVSSSSSSSESARVCVGNRRSPFGVFFQHLILTPSYHARRERRAVMSP